MPGQRKWYHDDSEDDEMASITLIETDEDEDDKEQNEKTLCLFLGPQFRRQGLGN